MTLHHYTARRIAGLPYLTAYITATGNTAAEIYADAMAKAVVELETGEGNVVLRYRVTETVPQRAGVSFECAEAGAGRGG